MGVAPICPVAVQVKLSSRQAGCSCAWVDSPGSIFGSLRAELSGGMALGGAAHGFSPCHPFPGPALWLGHITLWAQRLFMSERERERANTHVNI